MHIKSMAIFLGLVLEIVITSFHQQYPICIHHIKMTMQTIGSVLYLLQLGPYNEVVWHFNNNGESKVDFDIVYIRMITECQHLSI